VSQKNVIIARSIGETQLSSEKFPIERYATRRIMTPDTTEMMSADMVTIATPRPSYFGGVSVSSRDVLSGLSSTDICEYDEKCSN